MFRSTPVFRAAVLASETVIPAKSGIVTSWPCSAIRSVMAAEKSVTRIMARAVIAMRK